MPPPLQTGISPVLLSTTPIPSYSYPLVRPSVRPSPLSRRRRELWPQGAHAAWQNITGVLCEESGTTRRRKPKDEGEGKKEKKKRKTGNPHDGHGPLHPPKTGTPGGARCREQPVPSLPLKPFPPMGFSSAILGWMGKKVLRRSGRTAQHSIEKGGGGEMGRRPGLKNKGKTKKDGEKGQTRAILSEGRLTLAGIRPFRVRS
ncbi:hypothetical protein LY76DRAFT_227777 [Colletotrichum caudatum]|nr:hypothetical protein LY76DRAFT_227777 [Colletotrichum caudatum]